MNIVVDIVDSRVAVQQNQNGKGMDLQLTTTIGMYNLYIQHTTGAMNNGQWTMAER